MKKIVALAALVAASFAAPALPTQAASLIEQAEDSCLVLPMFKQECWGEARAYMAERRAEAVAATEEVMVEVGVTPPPPPSEWWPCSLAAPGSGHLLDC